MIPGLDCSKYQGTIDWQQVKAGNYQFANIKMSGADMPVMYYDPMAERNYAAAKQLGLSVGGTHAAGGKDPLVEADFFLQAMSPLAQLDRLNLDIEPTVPEPAGGWPAWAKLFRDRIYQKCLTYVFLYIDISQANAHDWSGVLDKSPLWLAAPSFGWTAQLPVNYTVVMQQGPAIHVPGITANVCDIDMWFGTLAELNKCGYEGANVSIMVPSVASTPISIPVSEPGAVVTPTAPNPTSPTTAPTTLLGKIGSVLAPPATPTMPTSSTAAVTASKGTAMDVVVPPKPVPKPQSKPVIPGIYDFEVDSEEIAKKIEAEVEPKVKKFWRFMTKNRKL